MNECVQRIELARFKIASLKNLSLKLKLFSATEGIKKSTMYLKAHLAAWMLLLAINVVPIFRLESAYALLCLSKVLTQNTETNPFSSIFLSLHLPHAAPSMGHVSMTTTRLENVN